MAETNELDNTIGIEEFQTLKPKNVNIEKVEIIEVGEKKYPKVVCHVKHPDAQDLKQISSVEYINPNTKKVENGGLFVNKDSDGKIRKNSALALFMNLLGASKIGDLSGKKDIKTTLGSSGYLTFRGY